MNLRDLKLRARALIRPGRVEQELDEELAFHIEREIQKHVAAGLSLAEARTRALVRFGPVPLAADECRDARGTAFVDASMRDILYACRAFRRAPLAALTIVATVALGLALVTAVFTLYSAFYLRVDGVRNPGELVEVRRTPYAGARVYMPFTRPQYERLRREARVFTDVFGALRAIETRIDGRIAIGTLVTGNYFHALGVNAALGRTLTPIDDESPGGSPVIVLSHKGWTRLAARDPAVIGRSMRINGVPYDVVGVTPEGFGGLDNATPDYWAPMSLAGRFRRASAGKEDKLVVDVVIGRLKSGFSPESATMPLIAWLSGQPDLRTNQARQASMWLEPVQQTFSDLIERLKFFGPVFLAFALILMIGCANVANLLLARGVSRQREIGIRLSLGASRWRIARQLLTESLLLALISAACAFALSRLFLDAAIYVALTTMPPEMAESAAFVAPSADWRVLLFLIGGAIVSTLLFGLVPALQATRLELVRTMRGELTRDARPRRARHLLIAGQVGASALLLICAAVFLRSAHTAAGVNHGVRTSDTVLLEIADETLRGAVLDAINEDPLVAAVAASSPHAMGFSESAFAAAAPAGDGQAPMKIGVAYQFASPEYFEVLGIDLFRGRVFAQAERSAEAGVVIVSDSTARRLWPNRDPVGQVMQLEGWTLPLRSFTVVGVVRDVESAFQFRASADADVYLPTSAATAGTSLTLRVHGDPEKVRQSLLDRLTKLDPALGRIRTLRTMASFEAYVLRVAFWVTALLGILALLLTVSGLFSVLSYLVEQRRKEIGVRMALGATAPNVARLVLSQSLRPVGFGLLAGAALAALLATVLMSTRAAPAIAAIANVFDPMAYAVSALCIVAACMLAALIPALRAARIDPIVTLKQE